MADIVEANQEKCSKCGLCCKTILIGLKGLDPEDVKYWGTLGHIVGDMCIVGLRCKQLKLDRCEVYEERPLKCRNFEVDGKACKLLRHVSGYDEGVQP